MTPDHASVVRADSFSSLVGNVGQAVLGKPRTISMAVDLICLAVRGAPAARGFPRHGQDDAGQGDRGHGAGRLAASSSPRTCCPPMSPGLPSTTRAPASSNSSGPDLRRHRPRRRDQPGPPKTQSRCWRSWRSRRSPSMASPRAPPVHGHRHPEPGRPGRHLPAARGATRSLPDQDLARLPGSRRDRRRPPRRQLRRRTRRTVS